MKDRSRDIRNFFDYGGLLNPYGDMLEVAYDALESLTPAERKLFLAYVFDGTYVGVARQYKVCAATIKKYIDKVKVKIDDYVKNADIN